MIKTKLENKMMCKATITNKSSVTLHGVKPGDTKIIDVDRRNVPKEICWRKRVRDSAIDGCVELKPIVKKKKKKKIEVKSTE